ncbi:MAG TPA: hypothetical protein PKA19_01085 [Bacillota bacterium]|nr:hypothetical protein [Bacillota bacterium]
MEWEPGYKERFPGWRSSDGQLRERKGEPGEKVMGYTSSEQERALGREPQKLMDFSNSYGALSAGFDDKKQLVLVTSRRHTKELSALPPESKALEAQTAKKVPLITGEFFVNEDKERREESAVSYRAPAGKAPSYIMGKLSELMEKKDFEVQDEITPFLSTREEKESLKYLRRQALHLARSNAREEKQALEKRIQFLTTVVADKERQQQTVAVRLLSLLEEAGKGRRKGWGPNRLWQEEDLEESEDEGKGEGEEQGISEDEEKGGGKAGDDDKREDEAGHDDNLKEI